MNNEIEDDGLEWLDEADPIEPEPEKPLTASQLSKQLEDFWTAKSAVKPEPAPVVPTVDVEAKAIKAMRLQEKMLKDIKSDFPNMNSEMEDRIREKLDSFSTYDSLNDAYNSDVHRIVANDVAMKLIRENKYVPTHLESFLNPTQLSKGSTKSSNLTEQDKEMIAILKASGSSDAEIKKLVK